jgi:hypothetical protein
MPNGGLHMLRGRIITPHISARHLAGEEVLMLAVLEQAFADLESNCPAVRGDAEAYFLAYAAESSAFSLDAVCGQFGVSPEAIRGVIRKRLKHWGSAKSTTIAQAA